ncbi:MAG: Protein tssc1 [Marteilia pararefringens]
MNGISNSLKVIKAFAQNPRHSNIIAIGGDSPSYFLYDLRNVSKPILEVCQHANSVVQLLFNCYFDQLILSTSVDGHAVVTNTNLDNYSKLPFDYSTLNVLNDLTYELADDCFLVNDVPLNPLMNAAWMENDPFKISIIDSDGIIGVHEMSQKHRNLMIDSVSKRSLEFTVLTTDSN